MKCVFPYALLLPLLPVLSRGQNPVPELCVRCLCQSLTECDQRRGCGGGDCGMFAITKDYWEDSGRPTVQGDNPKTQKAYENCAKNYNCASKSIQNYMNRFKRDCNGDGIINCRDFAMIHMRGPEGCVGRAGGAFLNSIEECEI